MVWFEKNFKVNVKKNSIYQTLASERLWATISVKTDLDDTDNIHHHFKIMSLLLNAIIVFH